MKQREQILLLILCIILIFGVFISGGNSLPSMSFFLSYLIPIYYYFKSTITNIISLISYLSMIQFAKLSALSRRQYFKLYTLPTQFIINSTSQNSYQILFNDMHDNYSHSSSNFPPTGAPRYRPELHNKIKSGPIFHFF